MTGASIQFDPELLRPLITAVVREAVAELERDRAAVDGRLAYSEREAAAMLGLRSHQLRDCRLRGEITASKGPGGRILYTRDDLTRFLSARRVNSAK